VYDEFVLPASKLHILGKEQLQGLATGGVCTPGEAMANSEGISLRYPLFMVSKVSSLPPDLRNRQLAVFLDPITADTRLNDDQLAVLSSGLVSAEARLSTLMWIKQSGIVEQLKKLKLCGGEGAWRFGAHMAAAVLMADGDVDCVKRYLAKAEKQCDQQLTEAEATGLTDDLGLNSSFDLQYFFDHASETTLEMLYDTASMHKEQQGMSIVTAIKTLIEDGTLRRNFDSVLRQFNLRERTLVHRVIEQLRKAPMTRGRWIIYGIGTGKDMKFGMSKTEAPKTPVMAVLSTTGAGIKI
jgi:hypothetical protein